MVGCPARPMHDRPREAGELATSANCSQRTATPVCLSRCHLRSLWLCYLTPTWSVVWEGCWESRHNTAASTLPHILPEGPAHALASLVRNESSSGERRRLGTEATDPRSLAAQSHMPPASAPPTPEAEIFLPCGAPWRDKSATEQEEQFLRFEIVFSSSFSVAIPYSHNDRTVYIRE